MSFIEKTLGGVLKVREKKRQVSGVLASIFVLISGVLFIASGEFLIGSIIALFPIIHLTGMIRRARY